MKKLLKRQLTWILLLTITVSASAQSDTDDFEAYAKANIGLTKFKILGVTQKQYAKCLETKNYFEPDKKLKFVMIEKTSFSDDGLGYDLVADDGILTSNQLYYYTAAANLLPGDYRETAHYNELVADESFEHSPETEKISIKCKFKWVRCSELTGPQLTVCRLAGWPFGGFQLIECDFQVDLFD